MSTPDAVQGRQGEPPVDPNLVRLLLAIDETELRLRKPFLSFDAYLHTLLEKAALKKEYAVYSRQANSRNATGAA